MRPEAALRAIRHSSLVIRYSAPFAIHRCMATDLPRVSLACLPTPVQFLPRLTETLNGPRIFIKRDDLTGLAQGGNKTRKLEFLVADAQECKADTLVTLGSAQSNHCRQTAAAAARCGLRCVLVLRGDSPTEIG